MSDMPEVIWLKMTYDYKDTVYSFEGCLTDIYNDDCTSEKYILASTVESEIAKLKSHIAYLESTLSLEEKQ